MSDRKIIELCFGIVILNIIIDHLFAQIGMMLTPYILTIIAFLIAFMTKNISSFWKSILTFGLVAFHDIGIKLYGGGSHDIEGQGWIHVLLFIGLLPTFGILVTSIILDKQVTNLNKIIAILVFPSLISIYLYFFSNLGLGRYF